MTPEAIERERRHHDELYSGFAQSHFQRPAVLAFREHFIRRLLRVTALPKDARVLSLGCGIGDTERMLAAHVREVIGIDLSEPGIAQARADAAKLGVHNVRFDQGLWQDVNPQDGPFDLVLAKFFVHHLSLAERERLPETLRTWLKPGGVFYALDPNRYRLLGVIGRLLIPEKMKQFQTEDEDPVSARELQCLFERNGFQAEARSFDYLSVPLAGLFPDWRAGYEIARLGDELLTRIPLLRATGSNVELIVRPR
ncbi:MAG: class I SAM-dependent methyltransferase [Bryobacteraceae bacterium]